MPSLDFFRLLGQLSAPDSSKFNNLPHAAATQATIQTLLTIVFSVTGAIAVIVVVLGGIKYSSSQGDPQAISKAKNTIIYAVVGLVVCIMATVIVQFAVGNT